MEIRPILSTLLRQRTGPLLVALQVAISLAILANALFIVQQRIATSQRASGLLEEQNVGYVFIRPLQDSSHNAILAQQEREKAALAALPGVVSVSFISQMPMSRSGSTTSVRLNPDQGQESASTGYYVSQPGVVKTLGLKIVEGRDLIEDDIVELDPRTVRPNEGAARTAVITLPLAKTLYPDATSYLGRVFYFGRNPQPVRVVGVVEALLNTNAQASIDGEYSSIIARRVSTQRAMYVIRAEPGKIDSVLAAARDTLRKLSPSPVQDFIRTVTEDRTERYRNEKALAWMLIAISALLLLVTVSGIVGMTMLRVDQRRKHIGVRRALGARWRDILRYFIVENLLITTGGVAAGLLLAVGLNRVLMSQIGIQRLPLEYLAFGAAALWALGVAAVYGPASRAANISPAIATRTA